MDKLTVYADPTTPNQRVYQLDEKTAGEASIDMLDAFRGAVFRHDLGVEAPGRQPKHNIPAQLQTIKGVGQIMFISPNYVVYIRKGADWEVIDPEIQEVLAHAFGEIGQVVIIKGSLD